jgi:uncharacterized tellurite resistance protein B-like protein
MFELIKHFFDRHIGSSELQAYKDEQLRVASAALLMEMLHSEEIGSDKKTMLIKRLLEDAFRISEEQADFLMDVAEQKRKQATDYYEFTHLINEVYTREQKIQLLEFLWQIAFLDGHLDIEEDYLVDKIARLIFIPHIEVLKVKNRVQDDCQS